VIMNSLGFALSDGTDGVSSAGEECPYNLVER